MLEKSLYALPADQRFLRENLARCQKCRSHLRSRSLFQRISIRKNDRTSSNGIRAFPFQSSCSGLSLAKE